MVQHRGASQRLPRHLVNNISFSSTLERILHGIWKVEFVPHFLSVVTPGRNFFLGLYGVEEALQ